MFGCINKRILSGVDDSIPLFSLNGYEGYARITSVWDGGTFNACIILHNRVLKFTFEALGYDTPPMTQRGPGHVPQAQLARLVFMELLGFNNTAPHQWWNPFICRNTINGWIWIKCHKNSTSGKTLVTIYKNKNDNKSINDKMIETNLVTSTS